MSEISQHPLCSLLPHALDCNPHPRAQKQNLMAGTGPRPPITQDGPSDLSLQPGCSVGPAFPPGTLHHPHLLRHSEKMDSLRQWPPCCAASSPALLSHPQRQAAPNSPPTVTLCPLPSTRQTAARLITYEDKSDHISPCLQHSTGIP